MAFAAASTAKTPRTLPNPTTWTKPSQPNQPINQINPGIQPKPTQHPAWWGRGPPTLCKAIFSARLFPAPPSANLQPRPPNAALTTAHSVPALWGRYDRSRRASATLQWQRRTSSNRAAPRAGAGTSIILALLFRSSSPPCRHGAQDARQRIRLS